VPVVALADGAVINDHIGFVDVVVIGDTSGRGARAYDGVATDLCAPHRLTRYWQVMRGGG
jgi:hypothetical protein